LENKYGNFQKLVIRVTRRLDSAVGVVILWLDDQGVGVQVLEGARIFISSCCPDWL
jgi:hypothetical protein